MSQKLADTLTDIRVGNLRSGVSGFNYGVDDIKERVSRIIQRASVSDSRARGFKWRVNVSVRHAGCFKSRVSAFKFAVSDLKSPISDINCAVSERFIRFIAVNERKTGKRLSNMKEIEEITEKLTCELCGKEFSCGASIGKCWCFDVELKAETLGELSEDFNNCLCEICLVKLAQNAV